MIGKLYMMHPGAQLQRPCTDTPGVPAGSSVAFTARDICVSMARFIFETRMSESV
jgi:hypothetical protein